MIYYNRIFKIVNPRIEKKEENIRSYVSRQWNWEHKMKV